MNKQTAEQSSVLPKGKKKKHVAGKYLMFMSKEEQYEYWGVEIERGVRKIQEC